MAYEPTEWEAGMKVTASRLNKIEQGIASGSGAPLIMHLTSGVGDKTWQEVYDALSDGPVFCLETKSVGGGNSSNYCYVVASAYTTNAPGGIEYHIELMTGIDIEEMSAVNQNSYPTLDSDVG